MPGWVLPALLAAAVLALHWPGGAVLRSDDYAAIAYAADWRNCLRDFVGPQYGVRFFTFWRPCITLSLGIDHWLFGTEPWGFLATNCLALVASALLACAILRRLSGSAPLAFVATLLWVAHPWVLIAQRWASGRVDTHLAPPLLLALLLHLRARRGAARWPVWLCAIWALGTKESAIGFPLLALGIDLLDPERPVRARRWPPALAYLLLIPGYLLLRQVVLGDVLGGYLRAGGRSDTPWDVLAAFGEVLSQGLLPGAPAVVAWLAALALLGLAAWRVRRGQAQGRARVLGALLVGAGLFGPLLPLLPALLGSGNQRWAYLACALMLLLWTWVAADLVGRRHGPLLAVGLLPLLWLLPARAGERSILDGHDRFVTSLVAAMRQCDALLPPGEPVVLAGDAHQLLHGFRFSWGLGSVLKPPWQPVPRDVIALQPFTVATAAPGTDLVCAGLQAWVELHAGGGRLVKAPSQDRLPSAPVGFDGSLTGDLIPALLAEARIGFPVGPGFDGRVALCTTRGSGLARIAPREGLLWLRDILMADVATDAQAAPLVSLIWIAADLDRRSPMFLFWRDGNGVHTARLAVGGDYAATYLRLWRSGTR